MKLQDNYGLIKSSVIKWIQEDRDEIIKLCSYLVKCVTQGAIAGYCNDSKSASAGRNHTGMVRAAQNAAWQTNQRQSMKFCILQLYIFLRQSDCFVRKFEKIFLTSIDAWPAIHTVGYQASFVADN